jgi:hypothetical protein
LADKGSAIMRVNFRAKIADWTLFAMIAKTQRLEGVTSLQNDGKHIVMWDLENCTLEEAERALKDVQNKFCLSDIFVVSDVKGSYRGWSLSRVDFVTYLKILLDTEFLDWNFFYWTVKRGKATLRTSSKKNRELQRLVNVIESYRVPFPSECQKVVYATGLTKRGATILLGD